MNPCFSGLTVTFVTNNQHKRSLGYSSFDIIVSISRNVVAPCHWGQIQVEIADIVGLSQNVVCKILRHHRQAGHFRSWKSPELPPSTTRIDDHWQANLSRRIRKIRRCHLYRWWRIHYGINVSRQTVRRVWFNVVTELEEYLYLHALLFLIEFLDLAGLGRVKGCWSDTGYMLSSGRVSEGAAPLIVKMEDRLSGD